VTEQTKNGTATIAPKAADAPTKTADDVRHITIPHLDMGQARLHVVGITPFIMHKWSEKAAKQIEDKVTGKAKAYRGHIDPEQGWLDAAYVIPGKEDLPDWKPGKYFQPAAMYKHAFLYGVGQIDDVKTFPKTKATGWFFVDRGDPVLQFDSCELRFDMGRNPTQPIYRPMFSDWSTELDISYNANAITLEQVVALLDLGGFAGGIGEWRPSSPKNKSGSFGRFRVARVVTSDR